PGPRRGPPDWGWAGPDLVGGHGVVDAPLPDAGPHRRRPRRRGRRRHLPPGRGLAGRARGPAGAGGGAEGMMAWVAAKYARRSVGRNVRRTALAVVGIAVGCALALFMESLNRGRDGLFA